MLRSWPGEASVWNDTSDATVRAARSCQLVSPMCRMPKTLNSEIVAALEDCSADHELQQLQQEVRSGNFRKYCLALED